MTSTLPQSLKVLVDWLDLILW